MFGPSLGLIPLMCLSLHITTCTAVPSPTGASRRVTHYHADEETKKAIQTITSAKSILHVSRAYRTLFRSLGPEGSYVLKMDMNDGIAIHAAWLEVVRRLPEKRQRDAVKPTDGVTQRFLGFVEGRLRCKLPRFWEEAVLNVHAYSQNNLYFTFSNKSRDAEVGSEKCDWSMVNQKDRFVSEHLMRPVPYLLHSIDRKSGRPNWKAEIWGIEAPLFFEGPGWHVVAVIADDNRVLVFGIAPECAYIEGVNAKTGRHLFRFSTFY